MVKTRRDKLESTTKNEALTSDDAVLSDLHQAEAHYRTLQAKWERLATELEQTRTQLARAQHENRRLSDDLDAGRRQADLQRRQAERQRERADQLAQMLRDIHRSIFSGNVYYHILKACLTLTGATRGLYITMQDKDDTPRIRAAMDMDGYPQTPPSDFIRSLCLRVLDNHSTLVCNQMSELSGLPAPASTDETFHNVIVAPVVLRKNLSGIIIAADKVQGDFDQHDADLLLSVGDQAGVAVENAQLRRELQQAYLSTVSVLADAMEAKDPYTQGHCELVSRYAHLIARHLSLPAYERSVVGYAALLHDIGKIGVSDGVLNKPGPLLAEERELVRSHVRVGHDLICQVPVLESVAKVVLHHHEWYDGTGYPAGLKGEEIPIAARIVCAVDAYCAMITNRSYKEAYSDEWARNELRRCAGTQFDPGVVDAFLAILELPEAHRPHDGDDADWRVLPGLAQILESQHTVH